MYSDTRTNKNPQYIFRRKSFDKTLNLLLITADENKHYVLIKDLNRFVYNQTRHKKRKHFYMFCLQCFSSEDVLKRKTNCITINGEQAVKMPGRGEKVVFQNYHRHVPFVIYADFEAITEKVQGCKPNNNDSYTHAYQKHTDCGYAYKVVSCYDDKYTKPIQLYRGENAVYKFMERMLKEVGYCKGVIKNKFNKSMKMAQADEANFKQATERHICNKTYTDKDKREELETIVT